LFHYLFAEKILIDFNLCICLDVLGLVTGLSEEREYLRDGKITKMVVVELSDDRLVLIPLISLNVAVACASDLFVLFYCSGKCECALFGDYAQDLKKMIGKVVGGLPIVAIQFAKLKIFRGFVCSLILLIIVCCVDFICVPDMAMLVCLLGLM
jgi:hypothetical protein